LPTSLKLHLPAVIPARWTWIEEVQPQQWALSDDANTCRSQRLWRDDPAKVLTCAPSDKESTVQLHSTIHAKSSNNRTVIRSIVQKQNTFDSN
jgi:hypothetical protein